MTVFIGLLRGINVGGNHKLPMRDLQQVCLDLGFRDPKTYIQSGNVVFSSDQPEAKVASTLEAALVAKFGFPVPIVVRSLPELEAAIQNCPYTPDNPKALYLTFLANVPKSTASLDPNRSPGDQYTVIGRDVYCNLGNGAADTKLTVDYFLRQLGTQATSRNWNTVNKLAELARSIA